MLSNLLEKLPKKITWKEVGIIYLVITILLVLIVCKCYFMAHYVTLCTEGDNNDKQYTVMEELEKKLFYSPSKRIQFIVRNGYTIIRAKPNTETFAFIDGYYVKVYASQEKYDNRLIKTDARMAKFSLEYWTKCLYFDFFVVIAILLIMFISKIRYYVKNRGS